MSLNLEELFAENCDEFLEFERIENPKHRRPDICAFIMLDELLPGDRDMVSSASHDEIFLDVDCNDLAEIATEEQIRDLIRCGIRYSNECGCLCMFV